MSWQSAGDSFSSGEGVFGNEGACAQSPFAYGPLVAERLRASGWPIESTFTACTGHLVEDYFNDRLDTGKLSLWWWGREQGGPERVDAITMSFGGNDIGFADVIIGCSVAVPSSWTSLVSGVAIVADAVRGCDVSEDELKHRVDWLLDPKAACSGRRKSGDGYECDLDIGDRRGSIIDFYFDVVTQRLTDRGQLYIVGYPSLFAPPGEWPGWAALACQGVRQDDAAMLLSASLYFNEKLQEAVERANQALGVERVHYLDRWNLYRGGSHELCGSGEDWLNGVSYSRNDNEMFRPMGSFHPNAAGHAAVADALHELVLNTFPTTNTTDSEICVAVDDVEYLRSELLRLGSPWTTADGVAAYLDGFADKYIAGLCSGRTLLGYVVVSWGATASLTGPFDSFVEACRSAAEEWADPAFADLFPACNAQGVAVPSSSSVGVAECISLPSMYIGMSGSRDQVALFQTELSARGYDPGDVDGYFGENTFVAAVEAAIDASTQSGEEVGIDEGVVFATMFERFGIAC